MNRASSYCGQPCVPEALAAAFGCVWMCLCPDWGPRRPDGRPLSRGGRTPTSGRLSIRTARPCGPCASPRGPTGVCRGWDGVPWPPSVPPGPPHQHLTPHSSAGTLPQSVPGGVRPRRSPACGRPNPVGRRGPARGCAKRRRPRRRASRTAPLRRGSRLPCRRGSDMPGPASSPAFACLSPLFSTPGTAKSTTLPTPRCGCCAGQWCLHQMLDVSAMCMPRTSYHKACHHTCCNRNRHKFCMVPPINFGCPKY